MDTTQANRRSTAYDSTPAHTGIARSNAAAHAHPLSAPHERRVSWAPIGARSSGFARRHVRVVAAESRVDVLGRGPGGVRACGAIDFASVGVGLAS